MSRSALTVAADLTLVAHASFVAFVVAGQVLILIGWMRGWRWTRNPAFRLLHLGAIVRRRQPALRRQRLHTSAGKR